MNANFNRVQKLLDWFMDRPHLEDTNVTVGCRTCRETASMMAATARTAWLSFHVDHDVWIKNPFKKKGGSK